MEPAVQSRADFYGVELPLGDELVERVRASVGARLFGTQRRRIGRYLLERTLGRGGSGSVWLALDPRLDRRVALKQLHATMSGVGAQARLLREARILAGLAHPNIVEVFDVGIERDQVYVVTELVEGGDLAGWLAQPHDLEEVVAVFAAAGRGLAAAHARGVIHRDFKPSNVLLTRDGVVKVADFGLAKRIDSTSSSEAELGGCSADVSGATVRTRSGLVLGTGPYMAPEQHQGLEADERSDVYAFCVSLYEGLHRRRPFAAASLAELEAQKRRCVLDFDPGVPARLQEVVRVGLRVDPNERWSSVREMVARLERRPRRVPAALLGLGIATTALAIAPLALGDDACEQIASAPFAEAGAAFAGDEPESSLRRAVSERLDLAAQRWVSAWQRSCRTHEDDGDAEALASRTTCLRRSARAFETVARALPDGAPERFSHAISTLDELPPPDACLDSASKPDEPSATELALERVRLLEEIGDHAAGLEAAREAVEHAGIGGAELPAALAWHGRLLGVLGRHAEAADDLERAYWLAAAAGDDEVAAQSAIDLHQVQALGLGQYAAAEGWKRHALAVLERGGTSTEATVRHHIVAARVALDSGDPATSLHEADAAIEAARALATGATRSSQAIRARGDALARLGRHAEAEDTLRALLDRDEARLGAEHPETTSTLKSLGGALLYAGRNDEAVEVLQLAVQRIDAAWEPTSAQRATARQALAAGLNAATRREEAAEVLEEAREIALASYGAEAMTLAIIDTNLGIVRARLGQFDEAEQHLERALAAVQSTFGVGHRLTWFPTEGLAQLERERGNKARAAELYETCAKILAHGEGVFARERYRCRTNAAQVRWLLGDHATAEREFRALIEIGPPQASELSDLELGLGISLRGLGRNGEAVPHLERALELRGERPNEEELRAWIETELAAARRDVASLEGT